MVQMFTLLKSSKLIILMFIFFSCLIFFQGVTQIPVLDRDEARFASATKNMLETENYIDISIKFSLFYITSFFIVRFNFFNFTNKIGFLA